MPLYLIRHTRLHEVEGLCYGRFEPPLAASFNADAAAVRQQLGAITGTVISSPAPRCQQLARQLTSSFQLDARLQELDFGDWEGRPWADIDSAQARHWGENWQSARCPQGEGLPDLLQRLHAFWRSVAGDNLIIISHAGPLRASLHLLTGLSLQAAFQRPIGFGEIIVLPKNPLTV